MEAEIVQGLAMAVFRLWGFVSAHELRPSIRLHLSPPVFLLLCLVASGGGRERDMLHQVGYFKTEACFNVLPPVLFQSEIHWIKFSHWADYHGALRHNGQGLTYRLV